MDTLFINDDLATLGREAAEWEVEVAAFDRVEGEVVSHQWGVYHIYHVILWLRLLLASFEDDAATPSSLRTSTK